MRSIASVLSLVIATMTLAQLGPEHRFLFPSSWPASDVAILDADADGDGDVVRDAAGRLWYYEQEGPGTWYVREDLGPVGSIACMLVTDLDGDGVDDLIFSDPEYDRIAWVRVLGDGTFEALEDLVTGLADPRQVVLEDLDGDGDKDLISFNEDNGYAVTWHMNNGGTFGPAQDIHTGTGYMPASNTFTVGDLDNDGDPDLAVILPLFTWYQNDGAGQFTTVTPASWVGTEILALDIDADGDQDLGVLIEGSAPDDNFYVTSRSNNGDGLFEASDTMAVLFGGTDMIHVRMQAADHEGDGDDDLYVQRAQVLNPTLIFSYLNDGSGAADQAVLCDPLSADGSRPLAIGHVDGDGLMDVVAMRNDLLVASLMNGEQVLELNSVVSPEHIAALTHPGVATKVVVGRSGFLDFSLDGALPLRLAMHGNNGGEVTHLPIDAWRSEAGSGVQAMYPADLDNDGDDDLICEWQDPLSGTFRAWMIMRNSGGSLDSIGRAGVPFFWMNIVGSPGIADMDGDGDVDLVQVAAGDPSFAVGLSRNNGNGTFAAAEEHVPDSTFFPHTLGLCDVDDDGDADYLWKFMDTLRWSANDGNGIPLPSQTLMPLSIGVQYYSPLDLNADGLEDLLIVASDSLIFLHNTGSDQFAIGNEFAYDGIQYELGDLDGNGFLDLVTINIDGDIFWYPNFGNGNIGGPFTLITGPEHTGRNDITLADMDGDGDLDVLTCSDQGAAAWLGNDGILPTGFAASGSNTAPLVYPDPMSDEARVVFNQALPSAARIELVDVNGRVVRTLNGNGMREVLIERGALPSGIYLLRIVSGPGAATAARLVVH